MIELFSDSVTYVNSYSLDFHCNSCILDGGFGTIKSWQTLTYLPINPVSSNDAYLPAILFSLSITNKVGVPSTA
jgi:hypothetical protein